MPDLPLPTLADLGAHAPFIVLVLVVPLVLGLLRRIPVIGTLVNVAIWAALAIALVVAFGQHERLDPYLGQFMDRLGLDRQRVVGGEVRIPMAPDGHFWARVRIGEVERRMLVDSGATVTALSTRTAVDADLRVRDELLPVLIRTANGTVRARTTTIPELRLGDIAARDLAAVVSPAFGDVDVLGMNFLSRLKAWRVEDGTLVLVPHRPQPEGDAATPGRNGRS